MINVEKLRSKDGLAPSFVWNYTHQDKPHRVTIQPALLEQSDGSFKAFFPGTTEELVEEVLIKMLADRQRAYHDDELGDSWVLFSLRDLFRELMRRGRTRNLQQLKHAIDVLSRCVITLERDGRKIYDGGIISSVFLADRDNFFDDADPAVHRAAKSVPHPRRHLPGVPPIQLHALHDLQRTTRPLAI